MPGLIFFAVLDLRQILIFGRTLGRVCPVLFKEPPGGYDPGTPQRSPWSPLVIMLIIAGWCIGHHIG